jgi:P27 family predicted phage terminase small subunit
VSARKPARLKLVEGDPGHEGRENLARQGLKLDPQAPTEPDWRRFFPPHGSGPDRRRLVEESKRARERASEAWREHVRPLDAHGLLSVLDVEVLTTLCVSIARREQLERRISIDGVERDGQKGRVRHPLLPAVRQYAEAIKWASLQLGLTPAARDGFAPAASTGDGEGVIFDV